MTISNSLRTQLLRDGTPLEDHRTRWGFWVKREDLSAREPGPPFSKTRGVCAHMATLPEGTTEIGVLDTYHSQAGHAVAHAARALGLGVTNFYPEYKHEPGHRAPQVRAEMLGARLVGLPAGRSAVLYHQAKKQLALKYGDKGYMMPNALKLPEMVAETAREVRTLPPDFHPAVVVVPISSGTIAAGVIRGFLDRGGPTPMFILHMGYDRSPAAVFKYVAGKVGPGFDEVMVQLINEKYGYKDVARPGPTPDWLCSPYYDLKAFRWWMRTYPQRTDIPATLFWNIG